MKKTLLILIILFSTSSIAGTMADKQSMSWLFNTGIGYVNYEDMVDANTTVLRLSAAHDIFHYNIYGSTARFGLEVGAQTGLDSRLMTSQTLINNLGGTAIQTVIKPFWDLLGTIALPILVHDSFKSSIQKIPQHENLLDSLTSLEVLAKFGFAYRQMHFDRDTIKPKYQISPEVQVGLSKVISKHMIISLVYQGVYSGNVGLITSSTNPLLATGTVKNIPMQNGGLLLVGWKA